MQGDGERPHGQEIGRVLREIGFQDNKIIIKSDQESAIKAGSDKLFKDRGEPQTIIEHSPVKSPGSNGMR